MSNTIGKIFRLTSFGESHGPAIGGVIDGFPAGIAVDEAFIQNELARRRPGQSRLTTGRNEADKVELLSGIFEGHTTGCPIGFIVRNQNAHSEDYEALRNVYRPSHADYTYTMKYGVRDHRGGGRSSARETIARVVAGAFAKLALHNIGVKVHAYTSQVGHIALEHGYEHYDLNQIERNAVRCPDAEAASRMEALIEQIKKEGDTVGGVITGVIVGCPVGLGEPVFHKFHAALGEAMLGINAAKGFEYGLGFNGATGKGSEQNDLFTASNGTVSTLSNRSGGVQGGITNGNDIYFRVAFKPVPTLLRPQETVTHDGEPVTLNPRGRHDPCVLPRAVPIVEAMAAMVTLDFYLLSKAGRM